MNDAPLPDVLQRIEDELGHGAMLQFAHAFGGQRINIPNRVRPNSPLARELGQELATKIVAVIGGGADITVPLGPTAGAAQIRRRISAALREHKSNNAVARELRVHEVTVRRQRKRLRLADDRQDDLFTKVK